MNNISKKKCFLLDLDGTIYLEDKLINGAEKFLARLKENNKEYFFFTNNSSKSPFDYHKKLTKLGIETEKDHIITSGQVTIDYLLGLKNNPLVYLVGTPSLEKQFIEAGISLTKEKSSDIDFLVLAFDTTLEYKKLQDAHDLILDGIPYLATNPDLVCPLSGGRTMPDCGSIISLLRSSTGQEPYVIGKPNTLMVEYIEKRSGIDKKSFAMVGDRLYTDILTAINAGITSILVLSGETREDDLINTKDSPDYIFNSVKDIIDLIC